MTSKNDDALSSSNSIQRSNKHLQSTNRFLVSAGVDYIDDLSEHSGEEMSLPHLHTMFSLKQDKLPPRFARAEELIGKLPKPKQKLMRAVVMEKLRRQELREAVEGEVLRTIRSQNAVIRKLKASLENFFLYSDEYAVKRIEETVELLKTKRKHQRKMKIAKLRMLVDNLAMMVEINPRLVELVDFSNFFTTSKAKLKEAVLDDKRRSKEGGSDVSGLSVSDSGSDAWEDSQMSETEREERRKARHAKKVKERQEKELAALDKEKENILETEKEQQQEFRVPEGMLLISKNEYVSQLEKLTADTKNLVKEELEKMYRVKQQELEGQKLREQEAVRRRQLLRLKLRACFHKVMFVRFLFKKSLVKARKKRELTMKFYSEKLSGTIDLCFMVVKNIILKNFRQVWDNDKSNNIVSNPEVCFLYKEKPPTVKEIDESANFLEECLRKILRGMIEMCKEEIYGNTLGQFLVDLTADGNFLPQNFLSSFEVKRLEFLSNGSVCNFNRQRRRLLLGSFVVFYILIAKVLTKPWTFDSSFKETNQRRLFLRIVGSILYYFAVDFFKKDVPVVGNNQVHIHIALRTEPRKQLFKMDERAVSGRDTFPEDTIFEDVFSKEDLKVVFMEKLAKFAKIPEYMEEFFTKLDEMVMRIREEGSRQLLEKRKRKALEQKILMVKLLQRRGIDFVLKDESEIEKAMDGKYKPPQPSQKANVEDNHESQILETENSHLENPTVDGLAGVRNEPITRSQFKQMSVGDFEDSMDISKEMSVDKHQQN